MKEIFDNYVETSFDGFQQAKSKLKQFELNYKRYFPDDKAKETLDIGIGRGEMLTCMRDWGFNYQGIDISISTVKFCESLNLKCEVTNDTARWLQENSERFALITCLDVLEHVPREHTIDFLKSIRAGLAEDGMAIIQVPNLQSPFGYLHHFNDFTHISGFVEHSLGQVLLAAGFKDFEFNGFEELSFTGVRSGIRLSMRFVFRKLVKFLRYVNSNPNPKVLDPVLYVTARK